MTRAGSPFRCRSKRSGVAKYYELGEQDVVFTVFTVAGYLSGATVLGLVGASFALVAAFLNAVFGLCLGCEAYLLLRRLRTAG